MRAPRLLFVSLSSTQFGGGEVYLLNILQHLAGRYELAVACARENGLMQQRLARLGIPFRVFSLSYRSFWATTRGLMRWQAEERFDLVHANGRRSQLFAAPLALGGGVPLVAADLVVNLSWTGGWGAVAANLAAALLNRVLVQPRVSRRIVLCEYMRRQCLSWLRMSPESVVTVFNAVDAERFAPQPVDTELAASLGIPPGARLIGCSARLVEHKGQLRLLEALDQLRRRGWDNLHLLLIGDGPDQQRLEQEAGRRGLSDRVHRHDFPPDIRPYLGLCELVVLASREEGLPTALIQAMAMGIPVVGSDVQGIPEVIRPGSNGELFSLRRPGDLARTLEGLLLAPPSRRQELGRNGRERVLQEFSLPSMLARIERIYLELLTRPGG